jgi:hypothetical protein
LPKKGIDDNQLICCDWVVGQRRFRWRNNVWPFSAALFAYRKFLSKYLW